VSILRAYLATVTMTCTSQTIKLVASCLNKRRLVVVCNGRSSIFAPIPSTITGSTTMISKHDFHIQKRNYHQHAAGAAAVADASSVKTNALDDLDDSVVDDDDSDDDDDDDDGRDDSNQPWKSLLELPSRAIWRASDPDPPDHVMTAQSGVLRAGGATAKQLRRTYGSVVQTHKALAELRERERRRIINRTHYSRKAQQRDDECQPVLYGKMETLAQLNYRLPPNYAIVKRVLEETKSLLGGNTSGGWKPKRILDMGVGVGSASAAVMEVFPDTIEWIHGVDPSRCMRECSKELLEEVFKRNSRDRINPPRLTLTGSLSQDSSSKFDMTIMAYTATELPGVAANLAAAAMLWQKLGHKGIFVMIEPGTPDGFHSIRSVRTMLLDCCPPPGVNRIDDDSDRDGDEDESLPSDEECHILAPCTHNGTCPMERYQQDFFKQRNPQTQMDMPTNDRDEYDFTDVDEDVDNWDEWGNEDDDLDMEDFDLPKAQSTNPRGSGNTEETDFLNRRFCSFVQTMSTGSHMRKGEKFSYLVAQKRIPSEVVEGKEDSSNFSFGNERLRDLLTTVYQTNEESKNMNDGNEDDIRQRQRVQALFEEAQRLERKYLDSEEDDLGLELLQGDINRSSFARIIRAPLKKRGHVLIDYCAAPGRLMRTRVSKSLDYTVAPGLYKAARKSRWGGLWPDVATGSVDYFNDKEEMSRK